MLACLQAAVNTTFFTAPKTVIVNSEGGSVTTAIDIADILFEFQADLIVRGQCNSSCANYFIPVSKSVRIEEGIIVLHGSIDEGLVDRSERKEHTIATYQKQLNFVARYNIPKGWLLYRNAKDYEEGTFGEHIEGRPFIWENIENSKAVYPARMLAVEEAFIKSCLPGIHIYPFDDTVVQGMYNDTKLRMKLLKQGVLPTGTMRCIIAP